MINEKAQELADVIAAMPMTERVEALNTVREIIATASPFSQEPVDCVRWVPSRKVEANDYNPNSVAPPEMELLRVSIMNDGYTQPIVAWEKGRTFEVIDGFHRNRVGKECEDVKERIHGYLPLALIRKDRDDRNDRIASTIRHNRARGKHKVDSMSDIVLELKRRNWKDERIARELGMDQDEILRLCQISGLSDLFSDREFSKAWDIEGEVTEADFVELTDSPEFDEETEKTRVANTNDEARVFHTYDKWECHKAGFYATTKPGMKKEECELAYRDFLSDDQAFRDGLRGVISEWKHSCEHYLTNVAMNRIAWLGQAACCYAIGIPSTFRSGFSLLSEDQQQKANETALEYLNKWLSANGRPEVTMEEAYSYERQSDIY